MKANKPTLSLTGTDQRQRMLPALEEGYFNVDEMSFEDLVSASVEFAAQLKYYNSSCLPSGDWRDFLATNEIVIMALIISKDLAVIRDRFRDQSNTRPEILSSLLADLVSELNTWLLDLQRSNSQPARELVTRFEGLIRNSLQNELQGVEALAIRAADIEITVPVIESASLSGIWTRTTGTLTSIQESRLAKIQGQSDVVAFLTRSAFEFLNAIEHLKASCRSLMPLALKTQSHDPAVSLFITFLKLYQHAQSRANTFTQRHLDFYYQDILKSRLRPRSLESVILNFAVDDGDPAIDIAAGRKFVCAKDEKLKDIVFETCESLRVTDASIAGLHTLRFEREPMITPECDMNFVTRIHKQLIPTVGANDFEDQQSWPIFGESGSRKSLDDGLAEKLEVGVAIASKVLFLDEGDRKIELDVGMNRLSKPISSYLEALEKATRRSEFIDGLHELMLGWFSDDEHQNWELAVSREAMKRLFDNADALDRRYPAVLSSVAPGGDERVDTCRTILEKTVADIHESQDKSLPYYERLSRAETATDFREGLGDLLVHFLLENGSISRLLDGALDQRARALACEKSLDSIKRELGKGRERLFKRYFGSAFVLQLSTDSGWLEIDRYDVLESSGEDIGFKIVLHLSPEVPAIVGCDKDTHGNHWQTQLPVVKLTVNPEASLNVYSLLDKFCLDRITVNATVLGARNIVAYNNISQLDPSKPFFPFGPAPTTSSYLALAAPEAAQKAISSFAIHLYWGDLPQGEEGFDGHYEGYASKFRNQSFTAAVNVLNNGSWQPQSASQIQLAPLFSTQGKKLKEHQLIKVQSAEYLRPVDIDLTSTEMDLGLRTRNGFVKLTLASPDGAFGHQEFPLKLSETLESNAKKKRAKKKSKLPRAPYTPLLNKISVDYTATSTMKMSSQSRKSQDRHPDKIFRLHPFGAEPIFPNVGGSAIQLFKPFSHDGNLFIALSGSTLEGITNIYFSLSDDSVRSKSGSDSELQWSYLGRNGWVDLQADQLIADGTRGFLCSGIVTLDLPADMSKSHGDMPGDYYWLRIGSNAASHNFCSLKRIQTHATRLVRVADDGARFDPQSLSLSSLDWQPTQSIPGLASIKQLDGFLDIGKQETRREMVTRISERIRHRARAVTGWDFERLILEQFPVVGNVMCMPNRSSLSREEIPGNLLVVVTPRVYDPKAVIGTTPKLSAVYLNEIQEYLSNISSTFANIEVTNPSYEFIQVRCAVVFEKYAAGGLYIDQLNEDIGRFLNPWDSMGYGLKFCQPVKREDIYSYIYNLDYIRYVTDFSMLQISRSHDGAYELGDTVKSELVEGQAPDIVPKLSWSLAVPLKRHHIDVTQDIEPKAPDITGIRELEIGRTFIIGRQ